jgi:hypothetical protein
MQLEFKVEIRQGRQIRELFRGDWVAAAAKAENRLAAGDWVRLVPCLKANEVDHEEK